MFTKTWNWPNSRGSQRQRSILATISSVEMLAPPLKAAMVAGPITPLRIAYHLLGFAYNWPLLPGRRRIKQLYFWKIRVLVKATILSLAHFSPIYLLSMAVMTDLILIAVEYRFCRYSQYFSRWWLFAHITINMGLIMLVFLPVI